MSQLTSPPILAAQTHASAIHSAFSIIHSLLHLFESDAVIAMMPPKFQMVAMAVAAIDSAVSDTMSDPATQAVIAAATSPDPTAAPPAIVTTTVVIPPAAVPIPAVEPHAPAPVVAIPVVDQSEHIDMASDVDRKLGELVATGKWNPAQIQWIGDQMRQRIGVKYTVVDGSRKYDNGNGDLDVLNPPPESFYTPQ